MAFSSFSGGALCSSFLLGALRWRYWEQRSAGEMGQLTGCTEKAVERLLYRAREQFRLKWRDREEGK